MGLTSGSTIIPSPPVSASSHNLISHDGLVGVDGDVLNGDLLLPSAAVPIQRLSEGGHGAGGLVGKGQILASDLKGLLRDPSPAVEVEAGGVSGDHLGSDHRLDRIGGREGALAV